MRDSQVRLAAPVAVMTLLAACSGGGAGPTTNPQVTFNLAVGSNAPAPLARVLDDTLTDPVNTLVLDTVQLVLREIRFKRVDDDACDGDDDHDDDDSVMTAGLNDGNGDDGEDGDHDDGDGNDGHSDGCEYFNAGPYLLDLPLDTGVVRAFSVAVDTGTYDQVRLKIHKPRSDSGDARDAQFLADHPEFEKVSIRAVGSYNGVPFVFTQDINAEQRLRFSPPLVVADSVTNVDVTIRVDVENWFRDHAGNLIDPATASKGGPNDSLVRDNIKDSFRAFRDDDCDGEDDDGGHGDDD